MRWLTIIILIELAVIFWGFALREPKVKVVYQPLANFIQTDTLQCQIVYGNYIECKNITPECIALREHWVELEKQHKLDYAAVGYNRCNYFALGNPYNIPDDNPYSKVDQ